jgi:hypothetical protein
MSARRIDDVRALRPQLRPSIRGTSANRQGIEVSLYEIAVLISARIEAHCEVLADTAELQALDSRFAT